MHDHFFRCIFGMPGKAQSLYASNHSDSVPKPHPASKATTTDRRDYVTHQLLKEFLMSESSTELAPRFTSRIETRFQRWTVQTKWAKRENLIGFLQVELLRTNLEVSYGSALFEIHTSFCEDFWYFSHHLYGFYRPFPRWTIRKAHAARARLLGALKHWQQRVLRGEIPHDDDDPYWGSEEVKKWHQRLLALDGFDEDAIASLYLGIIWV